LGAYTASRPETGLLIPSDFEGYTEAEYRSHWYHLLRMNTQGFNYRVLVVDDDPSVLEISSFVLAKHGYEVRKAKDGFEALVELRRSMPDVIISDLTMPKMSGFELLSVVRRRFPHIPVIAISGEYTGDIPAGLIADAFLVKGHHNPEELFHKIAELIEQSPIRPHLAKPDRAPVWIPLNEQGYFVVTCTDCLRSFSVPEEELAQGLEMRETTCTFCGVTVRYLADRQTLRKRRKAS
jgi:CheY-like chemotaxis protein